MKNTSSLQNNYASRLRRVSGNPAIVCLRCVTVALSGMSFMTVSHAYQLLESQGYIIARPQSGYYVAPQAIKCRKRQSFQSLEMKQSISTLIFLICCRPVAIRRSFRLPRPFPTRDFSPPTTKPLAGAGKQNRHSDERD